MAKWLWQATPKCASPSFPRSLLSAPPRHRPPSNHTSTTSSRLLELAWEAYADPQGFKNPHNYHIRVQRLARMGFELVRHIHNVEHDTHCFILKDVPRGVSNDVGLDSTARDNLARNIFLLGTLVIPDIVSCWERSCVSRVFLYC